MSKTGSARQIVENSLGAGKTYGFDDAHDENIPAEIWFQESDEGLILFLVFYSQACRWSRCTGCNLPSKMSSDHVPYRALIAQVDYVFRDAEVLRRREAIRKVIISNNGSILDEATFSSTAFVYLLAEMNLNFPKLKVLSIETRPEYVDLAELEFASRVLAEADTPTKLELSIGFEAFDDTIRNEVYDKGLSLATFERLAANIAPYGYHLKCYFMQKLVPGMSDEEAIEDIRRAIEYLDATAARHGISINMHLNPTYVASGTILEQAFRKGEYAPPRLRDVAAAARHGRDKRISVFIGLEDEGLAVDGGSFIRPGEEQLVEQLQEFNRTQDYDLLDAICDTV
jgi:radical SAM enzyme (TIGR01210 family)